MIATERPGHARDRGQSDPQLLHQLFEVQADRRPLECALVYRDRQWSYQEIEDETNRLARHLRALGARPGRLVGIYLDRSERTMIAILAVLKAGAAYVPVDPVNPADRIRHILTEAEVSWLITENALAGTARSLDPALHLIIMDQPATIETVSREPSERLAPAETRATPADLCYVMFTSGTTGRPKGIMTEHRHILAFTRAFQDICRIDVTDRVYQGFSLGFDGSVEEYVLAFAGGAPLVVGPSALARHGDETADYLTAHGVTYFSTVPTFLRLVTQEIPSVRLLVVSGEPCSGELVRRWARPGRRLLNVYGPTEATVNTTSWECRPDTAVLIGRPLSGYRTYVLDENRQPVSSGPGELYIGGEGVARGYLKQPELTAAAFVPDLFSSDPAARMYRTGDLVEVTDAGDLKFLGRIDSQVKVRGFRIELAEVEAALCECSGVSDAVATTITEDGQTCLAAFVVARSIDRGEVRDRLRRRLPAHMIPSFLDTIDKVPRLASGKVDRRNLPPPRARLVDAQRRIVDPSSEWESQLVAMWEELFRTTPVSVEDDFFVDLGGDSLLAAEFVTVLHRRYAVTISLRDVYAHPSIAKLAAVAGEAPVSVTKTPAPGGEAEATGDGLAASTHASSREVWTRTPRLERLASVVLQAVSALALYGLAAVVPLLASLIVLSVAEARRSVGVGAALLVGLLALSYPAWLAVTIALKWLIIGRYREGRWSAYGLYAARFWIARRFQAMSGAGLMAGTPAMSTYYRLMGATVGRWCILDTPFCAAFDLVTIGDESCIGAETQLLAYEIKDGMLRVAPITIGRDCFVGTHCALGLRSRMGHGARLGDLSFLPEDRAIPAGESWRGSPATPGPVAVPDVQRPPEMRLDSDGIGLGYVALAVVVDLVFAAALVPAVAVLWLVRADGWTWMVVALVAAVPLWVVSCCGVVAVAKRLVLRQIEPGVYSVEQWLFVRKWFVDALVGLGRTYLRPLYTTIYLPVWLRLLGARIGRLAEISTISQGAPDLFDLGDQSFFADGSMIGGRRFHRGHVEVARSRIGRRSFVGNSAVLSVGSGLGDECLLGVVSTPPEGHLTAPDRTEWLGSPAFLLPHRRRVQGFDESVTFEPTRRLYAHRLFVDAMRILVPGVLVVPAATAVYLFAVVAHARLSAGAALALLPVVAAAIGIGVVLAVAALKAIVMGRFEPVVKPLWCSYVWWNEVVNGAWETVAAPALTPLVGSPLFNVFLRTMGCRIGRCASVHTTLFSEFDLVAVGGWTALNEGVVVQNHLFEDRIMKSSRVTIGEGCSVGTMAVILYDSELRPGSALDPLSLVMKGSVVPAGERWVGIPAGRVSVVTPS